MSTEKGAGGYAKLLFKTNRGEENRVHKSKEAQKKQTCLEMRTS